LEEHVASIFWVEKYMKYETSMKVGGMKSPAEMLADF
jgi:hypothetical protein